jgi:hypothetical protein
VTGNVGSNAAFGVEVDLVRAGTTVATASTTSSAAHGSWSVTLAHPVGDDRDVVEIRYTGSGAPTDETILTGNGGNPNAESGWTGWGDLDTETTVAPDGLDIFPCFQVRVFAAAIGGTD